MSAISHLPHKAAYAQFMRDVARYDRENPSQQTVHPLCEWRSVRTVHELRLEVRRALNRRINSRAGADWRNGCTGAETDLRRDHHDLNSIIRHRVRIYQFRTQRMRSRFGHLLAEYEA